MRSREEEKRHAKMYEREKDAGERGSDRALAKKRERRRRNREIYLFSALFLVLFAGMFGYLIRYETSNHEAFFNNSYNSQQRVVMQENRRGTIFSADGQILAKSAADEEGQETRSYPFGEMYAHVIGYTGKGKTGIEALENYMLANSAISERKKLENEQNGEKNPGNDVYTSLDSRIQEAAYQALGAYRGAIVATEVKTGRILAMVSKPDFDPNEIAQIWEKVNEDTENAVLVNRVTQGLYPPGSTFKIVTALAYLRQNPDTWRNYVYQCGGTYVNGENRISCYHGSVHGRVDFTASFAKSCNASFANIGMSMDPERFQDTINGLLFNGELPLELPYQQAKVALSADSSAEDIIQTSIGQGRTQITPMQLNLITSAIANGGELMQPVLVDRIVSAEGRVLEENKPSVFRRLLTEEEAGIMTGLMKEVVQSGTGRKLKDLSYTAAGKTGSAEFNQVREDSHAWFTGFAPAEDPGIAVTVIVENVGSGGDYAVPLAKRVFDAWFARP